MYPYADFAIGGASALLAIGGAFTSTRDEPDTPPEDRYTAQQKWSGVGAFAAIGVAFALSGLWGTARVEECIAAKAEYTVIEPPKPHELPIDGRGDEPQPARYTVYEYDKFRGIGLLTFRDRERLRLTNRGPPLHLHVQWLVREGGSETATQLVFSAVGSDWSFLKSRDLTLLIDGRRLQLGTARHDGDVYTTRHSVEVVEHLYAEIPIDELWAIADAALVEGQLGGVEFQLTEDITRSIREIRDRSALVEFQDAASEVP